MHRIFPRHPFYMISCLSLQWLGFSWNVNYLILMKMMEVLIPRKKKNTTRYSWSQLCWMQLPSTHSSRPYPYQRGKFLKTKKRQMILCIKCTCNPELAYPKYTFFLNKDLRSIFFGFFSILWLMLVHINACYWHYCTYSTCIPPSQAWFV